LAATTKRARFERSLDAAVAGRRCSLQDLRVLYSELRRPGKHGMQMLGQVLSYRGVGYVPPESELERRLRKLIDGAGLRQPQWQVSFSWLPRAPGRVDGAWGPEKVIVEADGRRWHVRRDSMLEDRRRDREAQNHGYRVYRFLWEEIRHEPDLVAETLRTALSRVA
jgi:hypothetical protein